MHLLLNTSKQRVKRGSGPIPQGLQIIFFILIIAAVATYCDIGRHRDKQVANNSRLTACFTQLLNEMSPNHQNTLVNNRGLLASVDSGQP